MALSASRPPRHFCLSEGHGKTARLHKGRPALLFFTWQSCRTLRRGAEGSVAEAFLLERQRPAQRLLPRRRAIARNTEEVEDEEKVFDLSALLQLELPTRAFL